MFRLPVRFDQLFRLFFLVSMVGGTHFLPVFAKAIELSPMKVLEQRIDQLQALQQEAEQNKYFQNDQIITNPYAHTQRQYHLKQNKPLMEAFHQTNAILKEQYACDLKLSELAIILSKADPSFKSAFSQQFFFQKEAKLNQKGEKELLEQSCHRLGKCMTPEAFLVNFSEQTCQRTVLDIYVPLYQHFQDQAEVEVAGLGRNKYLNGELYDSEFDLLYDVAQIGKVFFQGFKAAPELAYYKYFQMPLFNQSDESKTDSVGKKVGAESQNLNKKTQKNQTSDTFFQEHKLQHGQAGKTAGKAQATAIGSDEELAFGDQEIDAFLRKREPQTALGNQEHLLFQNQCIFPEIKAEKTEEKSDFSTSFSPLEAEAFLEKQMNQGRDFFNTVLQPLKPIEEPAGELGDLKAAIAEINPEDLSEQTKACVDKCDARDKNGEYHYAFDERLICKAQCYCLEYSSPALSQEKPLVDQGALRVRFCSIPVEIKNVDTSAKNIYALGEILDLIAQVSSSLYQGGKLSVQKMPQEVLDNKHSDDHSIAKTASFGIGVSVKKNPKLIKAAEQEQHNALFLDTVKSALKTQERNQFLILAKTDGSSEQQSSNSSAQQTQNTADPEKTKNNPLTLLFERQHYANVYLEFVEWLDQNEAFLKQMNTQLAAIQGALTQLEQKK